MSVPPPILIQKFNEYDRNPKVFAMDNDLAKAHDYFFFKNGFNDGVEYQMGVIERASKTSSRDVEALRSAIAVKDVRLMLLEQEIKRLGRLVERRNRALEELETVIGVIVHNATPDKISIRLAADMLRGFGAEYFGKFKREIV